NRIIVEVSGISPAALQHLQRSDWKPPQWQRLLSVYAEKGDLIADVGLPPMLGAFHVEAEVLRFEPQFPLEPGVTYRAVLRLDHLPGESSKQGELVTAV